MCADTSFHAPSGMAICWQAAPLLGRVTFLPQNDRPALIEPDDRERILADIDAHRGNGRIGLVGHGSAPLILLRHESFCLVFGNLRPPRKFPMMTRRICNAPAIRSGWLAVGEGSAAHTVEGGRASFPAGDAS
jgi:hypothetical protein